jgi:hypothetical protein
MESPVGTIAVWTCPNLYEMATKVTGRQDEGLEIADTLPFSCAGYDDEEVGLMKILVAVSILVMCTSSTPMFAQSEEGVTAIEGKVVKVDSLLGSIIVRHKCQIIDPQATFVKEDDITYRIRGDTALVKVETVVAEDGISTVKETPILLGDLKSGDQVRISYLTRDWEVIVRKVAMTK